MTTAKMIATRLKMTEERIMPVNAPVFTVPVPLLYMSVSFLDIKTTVDLVSPRKRMFVG
jgi:hypothetical protein